MASAGGTRRQSAIRPGAASKKKRSHRRRPVVYAGVLERDSLTVKCIIVDISAKGAKVRTLEPYMGTFHDCVLVVGDVGRVEAEVVWRHANQLGLEFREPTALCDQISTSSVTDILAVLNRK